MVILIHRNICCSIVCNSVYHPIKKKSRYEKKKLNIKYQQHKVRNRNRNRNRLPGLSLINLSQMQGPLPSLSVIPSTWYEDAATPQIKPSGKLSLLSPSVLNTSSPKMKEHCCRIRRERRKTVFLIIIVERKWYVCEKECKVYGESTCI